MVQSVVANYIRTKVSFELVKSQVACLRGSRRKGKMKIDGGEIELVSTTASIREWTRSKLTHTTLFRDVVFMNYGSTVRAASDGRTFAASNSITNWVRQKCGRLKWIKFGRAIRCRTFDRRRQLCQTKRQKIGTTSDSKYFALANLIIQPISVLEKHYVN